MPSLLNAKQLTGASWADISIGGFDVSAKSIIETCPGFLPRCARFEFVFSEHKQQIPVGL